MLRSPGRILLSLRAFRATRTHTMRANAAATRLLACVAGAFACVHAHKAEPPKPAMINLAALSVAAGEEDDFAISVSPSTNLIDGDWVNVSFSSPSPSAGDLILIYAPLPANFSATAPIEWFTAAADPAYLTTGEGTVRAHLVNMRSTVSFVLAQGGPTSPTVKAVSNVASFANTNEPRAARLALTGSPTEMRVSWSSAAATGDPRVTYSAVPGGGAAAAAAVPTTLPATSLTYTSADLCGPPATTVGYRPPGYVHTVVLPSLTPGQAYSYTVGDDTGTLGPFTFTQPPLGASSPTSFPFVFTAVGDMGQLPIDGATEVYPFAAAPNTTRYVARDAAEAGSLLHLHIGDLSYARGYGSEWDLFWNLVSGENAIANVIPYHVSLGNHERDAPASAPSGPAWLFGSDSGGECGVPTVTHFLMPSPDGVLASRTALWWATSVGPLFTVHFSSELDTTPGGALWTFVKTALGGVDRSTTPWVVVATHRPMYISSTNDSPDGGDQTVAATLRTNIEPLLMDAGGAPVDLFLQGHHHSYQRGSVVYNMTVVAHSTGASHVYPGGLAPLQMCIGTGGAGFSTNIQTPQPEWAELVEFWWGHARVTLHNASALQWEFVNDADGSVTDEAWIVK